MAFNGGEIFFGLDLRQAALCQVDFLQIVDKKSELLEEASPTVQFALQRYEKLWLPLAAKYCDRFLAAPIDIEWIWHCHLLNPAAYEKDCRKVAGKVVDHRLLDRERRKQSLQESRVLWRHEYPSVPFEADGLISPWFDSDFTSQLSYNLGAAVTRQKIFFYQVSLPHYKDEKFISQSLLRYKKFLHLKKLHPNTFIVPCYDIDLIWHTHMLHPVTYRHDTVKIIGHPFNHDDSVNDRRAGSKLTVSDARTRHLWKKMFDEPFSQSGAMFRGEPSRGKLLCMEQADFTALVTKQTTVLLESARVIGLPEHYQGQYKLKLWYNTGYQNFNRALTVSDSIATVRGSPRHLTSDVRVNANFTFDTKYNDVVMVDLIQKSGRFCLGATAEVGSAQLRMLEKIQALDNGRGISTQDTVDMGDGVGVQLQWSVTPPITGGCILALRSGDYQDCIMPETVESMWGPVPLPRLPPGVNNKCSVASHSLLNHTKRVIFTVRMIHSLPLMMSAVHVYFKDKMAAVGHLVGADQLPLPQLVKNQDRCVTLDIKNGERAVLLKNHAGDWGVVLGHWTGMRKPVPATESSSGRRGIPGDPGHLEVRFFKFSTRHWRFLSFEQNYSGSEHKFTIESATVELDSGLIEISSQAGMEVAENLCLAFSVALLHVLCQPRPRDWDPSAEAEDNVDGREASARPRMATEGLALIMAAGFLTLAPSNHLLRKRHREAMEAQAEDEARRKQQEEDEEDRRQRELDGAGESWGGGVQLHNDDSDSQDAASGSGAHDVVAIVSAEDSLEAATTEPSSQPAGETPGVSGSANPPPPVPIRSPSREGRLHRMPSIAESHEEDAETAPLCDDEDEAVDSGLPALDLLDMSAVASSLNDVNYDACQSGKDSVCEVDADSPFPLPLEDLPLPSDDLLLRDETYRSSDEDIPLPDVPEDLLLPDVCDDDLPLPIEELPLPDMSSLNQQPQAEALQMSSANYYVGDACDKAVGFDDDNAVGYEEYLDLDADQLDADGNLNIHDNFGIADNGHCLQYDYPNGAPNGNDGYDHCDGNHIPQEDFRHYNGDLDHFDDLHNDMYSTELSADVDGGDFRSSGKDLNGDDHFGLYNGDDVSDMYVNDTNYISYEDTNNYDGFYAEDTGCGGEGGNGISGDGDGGGLFGNCDGSGGDTAGGGDSGASGGAGQFLVFGEGDFGGDGGGAGCGGGGGGCGGGGAGCGGGGGCGG